MVILNQVVILGKISKIGQVKELSKSKRTVNIVLHVPRNSKTYKIYYDGNKKNYTKLM